MKKFLIKVGIFITPLALVCVPAFLHLNKHRELVSLDEALELSQREGALVGFAYSAPDYLLKYRAVELKKPEVLALGSSRVLPIRSNYFYRPEGFYNAGMAVRRVRDFRRFLEDYPAELPKIFILSLDHYFFNENYDDFSKDPRVFTVNEPLIGGRFIKALKGVIKSIEKGKFKGGEIQSEKNIGATGRINASGFRADGSYCSGGVMLKDGGYQFEQSLKQIADNKSRFSKTEEIHAAAVDELALFLAECQKREIHVVAFLPPYAAKVYDEFKKSPDSYPHIFSLHAHLKLMFDELGLKLFDFGNMKDFGASDFETTDGFHGSEVCYLRMMIEMSEEDEILKKYVDCEKTKNFFKEAYSSRQFIKEVEEKSPKPVISPLRD